jgi:hypothetical protein
MDAAMEEDNMRMRHSDDHPCHNGPVEIVKNLFCGGEGEALAMVSAPIRVDTLIPLNRMDAVLWNKGFRGEILYYPIADFGILPDDVLQDLVEKILKRISSGKKVGLFCMGGHGRTGYVAAVVLGKLGHKDPIKFLRSRYCRNAVESDMQIQHIADVLGKPELAEKYTIQHTVSVFEDWIDCGGHYGDLWFRHHRQSSQWTDV